jgi:hypothetical protein
LTLCAVTLRYRASPTVALAKIDLTVRAGETMTPRDNLVLSIHDDMRAAAALGAVPRQSGLLPLTAHYSPRPGRKRRRCRITKPS